MKTWITVDPGETTGWAIWQDLQRVEAGQTQLWQFIDALDHWASRGSVDTVTGPNLFAAADWDGKMPIDPELHARKPWAPLDLIVMEDWVLYPPGVGSGPPEPWNKQRTVRGIGAIELIARQNNIPLELQGTDTKEIAIAAGAEELFLSPVHENRHANDATMHGVFRIARKGRP